MNSNNEELNILHLHLLLICDEIVRLCKKNNIKYSLIGGSLLGAVRHKGFIPWDDDLDIGMPRSDYDKFLDVCEKDLSDKFVLLTSSTDNYGLPFSKIELKNTKFNEPGLPSGLFDGIFVDIFPIDVMPKKNCAKRNQRLLLKYYYGILLVKMKYRHFGFKGLVKRLLLAIPSIIMSKKHILNKITKISTKYNNDLGNYLINLSSSYKYGREIFSNCFFDNLIDINFENRIYSISSDYDFSLKNLYGDYNKLPPIEQRVYRHSEGKIVFDSTVLEKH